MERATDGARRARWQLQRLGLEDMAKARLPPSVAYALVVLVEALRAPASPELGASTCPTGAARPPHTALTASEKLFGRALHRQTACCAARRFRPSTCCSTSHWSCSDVPRRWMSFRKAAASTMSSRSVVCWPNPGLSRGACGASPAPPRPPPRFQAAADGTTRWPGEGCRILSVVEAVAEARLSSDQTLLEAFRTQHVVAVLLKALEAEADPSRFVATVRSLFRVLQISSQLSAALLADMVAAEGYRPIVDFLTQRPAFPASEAGTGSGPSDAATSVLARQVRKRFGGHHRFAVPERLTRQSYRVQRVQMEIAEQLERFAFVGTKDLTSATPSTQARDPAAQSGNRTPLSSPPPQFCLAEFCPNVPHPLPLDPADVRFGRPCG